MAHQDDQGNWYYDDGDTDIVDPHGNPLFSNDPTGDGSGAFAGVIADFVLHGTVNGNFALPPSQGADTFIGPDNRLPYWEGPTQVSGAAISGTWAADSSSPSGHNLRNTIAPGATNDEVRWEQVVPVGGDRGGRFGYQLLVAFRRVSASGGAPQGRAEVQYLKADGTTTGAATSATVTLSVDGTLYLLACTPTTLPTDAYSARLRVGVARNTMAAGDNGVVDIVNVRFPRTITLPDISDPQTYTPGRVFQKNGVAYLAVHAGPLSAPASNYISIANKSGGAGATYDFAEISLALGVYMYFDALGFIVAGAPLTLQEQDPPATPASGLYSIYPKTDGKLYGLNDAGVEAALGGGGAKTVIRPSIGGTVNDWSPAGLAADVVVIADLGGANRIITGIAAQSDGAMLYIMAQSSTNTITLSHLSGSSSAANQFRCPAGVNYVVGNKAGVALVYDGTDQKWRVVGPA